MTNGLARGNILAVSIAAVATALAPPAFARKANQQAKPAGAQDILTTVIYYMNNVL